MSKTRGREWKADDSKYIEYMRSVRNSSPHTLVELTERPGPICRLPDAAGNAKRLKVGQVNHT